MKFVEGTSLREVLRECKAHGVKEAKAAIGRKQLLLGELEEEWLEYNRALPNPWSSAASAAVLYGYHLTMSQVDPDSYSNEYRW